MHYQTSFNRALPAGEPTDAARHLEDWARMTKAPTTKAAVTAQDHLLGLHPADGQAMDAAVQSAYMARI